LLEFADMISRTWVKLPPWVFVAYFGWF